jgi:TorA maturation chaperone TorD
MTQASVAAIDYHPPVSPEDRARADMYALLSRLFYAAPDEGLLRAIARAGALGADEDASPLASAWHELTTAAALAEVDAVRAEYDGYFVGTGKADITLYSTAYLAVVTQGGQGAERHLVALRDDLASLGVARSDHAHEPEDHFSALCDVMRFLIVGDGRMAAASLDRQREFFESHLSLWFEKFVDAIEAHGKLNFYRDVGRFARAFLELERESFSF